MHIVQHNLILCCKRAGMLLYQPHFFQYFNVFLTAGSDIDSGRIDIRMTENISQLGNVFLSLIEHRSEQMPEVMRKYLRCQHSCCLCKLLQTPPDVAPVQRLTAFGDKNRSFEDFVLFLPLQIISVLPILAA